MSNWANWEYKQKYKYQGEAGEYLFSKANGEYTELAVEQTETIMKQQSNRNSIEYRVKIREEEYYFSEQKAIEQVLKSEKRKEHINTEVAGITWHDNGEFLIKVVSEDRKEGYIVLYKLYDDKIVKYK